MQDNKSPMAVAPCGCSKRSGHCRRFVAAYLGILLWPIHGAADQFVGPRILVAATYHYTATVDGAARQQGTVTASGLDWQCGGSRCRISGPWSNPGVGACQALAAKVGRITSYGHPGKQLDTEQLASCNQGVNAATANAVGQAVHGTAAAAQAPASAAAVRGIQDQAGTLRDMQTTRDAKQIQEAADAIRGTNQLPQGGKDLGELGDTGLGNRGGDKFSAARDAARQTQESEGIQSAHTMPAPTDPDYQPSSRPRSAVGPSTDPRSAVGGAAGTKTGGRASLERSTTSATGGSSDTGTGGSASRGEAAASPAEGTKSKVSEETRTEHNPVDEPNVLTRTTTESRYVDRSRDVTVTRLYGAGRFAGRTSSLTTRYDSNGVIVWQGPTGPAGTQTQETMGSRWGECNPLTGQRCPEGARDPNRVLPPREGDDTVHEVKRVPRDLQKKTYTDPSPDAMDQSGRPHAPQRPQSPDPGPQPPPTSGAAELDGL